MSLSFPVSPSVGQVYQNWKWDGAVWGPVFGQPNVTSINGKSGALTLNDTTGPGNRILLNRQTVSTPVAAIVFTGLDATYDEYVVESFGVTYAVADLLAMNISTDGGATWVQAGYGIGFLQGYTGGGAGGGNYNYMWAGGATLNAAIPANATLRLFRPAFTGNTSKYFRWSLSGALTSLGVVASEVVGGLAVPGTGAYNAIRFFGANGSNNFNAGTHSLYGVQK